MKKLFVLLCCVGGFLLVSTQAFAQKGDCSYWGGVYRFKTYEPWLYEIVKQDKKEKEAAASTNNQANIKNVWLELKDAQIGILLMHTDCPLVLQKRKRLNIKPSPRKLTAVGILPKFWLRVPKKCVPIISKVRRAEMH